MRRPDISSPCRAVTQTKAGEVSRRRTDPILPSLSLPLAALHRQSNGGKGEEGADAPLRQFRIVGFMSSSFPVIATLPIANWQTLRKRTGREAWVSCELVACPLSFETIAQSPCASKGNVLL